jgi:hypothetical protein
MNIEELNKLIQEELAAYLNEEQTDEAYHEDGDDEGDDDIEVTTDEPAEEDDALDTLRQIYNMLKPIVEPEMEEEPADEEPADEEEDLEELDRPNYKASDTIQSTFNAEKIKGGLNESFDAADRFKKLANIK